MADPNTPTHPTGDNPPPLRVYNEALISVFQVRRRQLCVLIWRHTLGSELGSWALPGGRIRDDEDLDSSARRQLADKVDVRQISHLEQLGAFSAPHRVPGDRVIATGYVGLLPSDHSPNLPPDTQWWPVDDLPDLVYDHRQIIEEARRRLVGKLSYTNLGFALAPSTFPISVLRDIYAATLGYPVDATNLQRILTRRQVLERTFGTTSPGPSGGRPAGLFRFTTDHLQVTDPFAALKPPPGTARD